MSRVQLCYPVGELPSRRMPRVLTPLSIIEPLASRCSKFRFKPLDPTSTSSRLAQIATAENVPVTDDVITALISTSHGDLRRSITYLQSASRLSMSTSPPTPVTASDIQEIAGVVPDAVINDFAATLGVEILSPDEMKVDGIRAKGFDDVRQKVKDIVRQGYSASQILSQVRVFLNAVEETLIFCCLAQLHDLVIEHPTLTARQKSRCALVFAEADKALCDGADEELWILEVGLRVHKALAS